MIVTDGFTGNVALKTVEGALLGLAGLVFGVLDEPGAPWADAADALKLRMLEAAAPLLPDNTGGALLLGVERRVHHLARLVVGDRDRQRGARRARLRRAPVSSTGSPRPRPCPGAGRDRCPPRRTATAGRSTATRSSASCASSSPRSSSIDPDAITPDSAPARRPRRRRLRAHRARGSSRGRARRAHGRAHDRRRRPRRVAHRARRDRVRRWPDCDAEAATS